MIFNPKELHKTKGSYVLPKECRAKAHPSLGVAVIGDFWCGFSRTLSTLHTSECDGYTFTLGDVRIPSLDGYAYAISITEGGIAIIGESEGELIRGYMTLLDRFKMAENDGECRIELECCEIRDRADVEHRMVHFCVFPETELFELQRFLRFAAALKYTHVVVEFWGMLKYDCLPELAWNHAYEKEEIRPIFDEGRALGLEIVPMLNHWGHAPGSRVIHGKHVVLDNAPTLAYLFDEDGWCWDISKPCVRELLKKARLELIDLAGEGKYFHVGCDEPYNFDLTDKASADLISGYLNEIAKELSEIGRRAIMWGDMLLYKRDTYSDNGYICLSPTDDAAEYMRESLDKRIIIADWQYNLRHAPVETAITLRDSGFDTMLCPWDQRENVPILVAQETVKAEGLFGLLQTTWHTLSTGMPSVLLAALGCLGDNKITEINSVRTAASSLLRKVMPAKGDYRRSGFAKYQVDVKW